MCRDCRKRRKAIRLVFTDGSVRWVCRPCASLWQALAHVITGKRPEYEPVFRGHARNLRAASGGRR